jgi:cellulose synthase/poly-beta-1,6-N-acetylglucosamine synthase-like glycosyltransferase
VSLPDDYLAAGGRVTVSADTALHIARQIREGHFEVSEGERLVWEHSSAFADLAANRFTREYPQFAARLGMSFGQRLFACGSFALLLVALWLAPAYLLASLTVVILANAALIAVASTASMLPRNRNATAATVSDSALPFVTILVPVYLEAAVVGDLVKHLATLDYPPDKLEVLMLVERRDMETRHAILQADPAPFVRVVELPPGTPQTKPRSCNIGFLLARGDLVVVFDAEDRPEPGQLRFAASRFAIDSDLACLQARLLFYNGDRNTLTRQFHMEYALRFGMIFPGLARLQLPIPLGGTSNYFRADALRAAGGWDAWNVTEDADLGMRLAALGMRADMLGSTTWGEATASLSPFIRQRTRWMKGFLVTTMVHTRRPLAAWRRFGIGGMTTLLGLLTGTVLAALFQPIAILLAVLGATGQLWSDVGAGLVIPSIIGLLVSWLALIAVTAAGAVRCGLGAAWLALLAPLHTMLWFIPSCRAMWQLFRSPFTWEKTPHGC